MMPEPGNADCYHIWVIADGERAMFMRQRCYTQSAAKAAIRRWCRFGDGGGDRPKNLMASADDIRAQTVIMRCRTRCPCRKFRGGCGDHREED